MGIQIAHYDYNNGGGSSTFLESRGVRDFLTFAFLDRKMPGLKHGIHHGSFRLPLHPWGLHPLTVGDLE